MSSNQNFVNNGGILRDRYQGRLYICKWLDKYEFHADGELIGSVDSWDRVTQMLREMLSNVPDTTEADCISSLLARVEE